MIETRVRIYYALAILTTLCSAWGAFIAALVLASVAPYIVGNDGLILVNCESNLPLCDMLFSISHRLCLVETHLLLKSHRKGRSNA